MDSVQLPKAGAINPTSANNSVPLTPAQLAKQTADAAVGLEVDYKDKQGGKGSYQRFENGVLYHTETTKGGLETDQITSADGKTTITGVGEHNYDNKSHVKNLTSEGSYANGVRFHQETQNAFRGIWNNLLGRDNNSEHSISLTAPDGTKVEGRNHAVFDNKELPQT